VEAEWHGARCVVTQFQLDGDRRLPAAAVDLADPTRPRLREIVESELPRSP
jgi:hypothetical protein